jgi:hypothetical protein
VKLGNVQAPVLLSAIEESFDLCLWRLLGSHGLFVPERSLG